MREDDLKRLNNLTEELERRIVRLESKTVKKEELSFIEESFEGLLFNQENNSKRLCFIGKKRDYAILNLQINSPLSGEVTCEIYCNGELLKSFQSAFPIACETHLLTQVGENRLKIVLKNEQSSASYSLDMSVSLKGYVQSKPVSCRIGNLLGENCYIIYGDTMQCINSDTMKTVTCYTDYDVVGAGYLKQNYNVFLLKKGDYLTAAKHVKDSNTAYGYIDVGFDVGDCVEMEVNNGVTYIYELKDGRLIFTGIKSDKTTFNEDINVNAVRFSIFSGDTGRYICYTDVRGNCYAIKHKSYLQYQYVEEYSLGKLQNANLCEENGELIVTYKQGLVVMKKPVTGEGEAVVMGVGDEGIISRSGVTLIRRANKLIKV